MNAKRKRVARVSVYVARGAISQSVSARRVVHREFEVPEEGIDPALVEARAVEAVKDAVARAFDAARPGWKDNP